MPSSGVRIAVWPQPSRRAGCVAAVLGDPAVVGVEAGLLVVEVRVVAEHHADGRVDDLGGDAVAILVGEARVGIPAAAVQVLEAHAGRCGSPRPACRRRRPAPSASARSCRRRRTRRRASSLAAHAAAPCRATSRRCSRRRCSGGSVMCESAEMITFRMRAPGCDAHTLLRIAHPARASPDYAARLAEGALMADLLALSTRAIDEGAGDVGPLNRINHELSELADGIAMVEAFSHAIVFRTQEGLRRIRHQRRRRREAGGGRDPRLVARALPHARVHARPRRSRRRLRRVPGRRHGRARAAPAHRGARERAGALRSLRPHQRLQPHDQRAPVPGLRTPRLRHRRRRALPARGEREARRHLPRRARSSRSAALDFELHHAKGETDDHSWAWLPQHKAICAGDFFIWVFPNAGNPQKVQRYPLEWAAALREMAARGAELLLPAHGLPIAGAAAHPPRARRRGDAARAAGRRDARADERRARRSTT